MAGCCWSRGLLTPVAAALVTFVMLGAGWFAGHWFGGVTGDDGWELVGVIIAGVAAAGGDRARVGSASTTSSPERREREPAAVDREVDGPCRGSIPA